MLHALAAARIEKRLDTRGPLPPEEELARLATGLEIDGDRIPAIAESTLLAVLPEQPADPDFLPLIGANARPVAFLAWDSPRLGTTVLRRIAPLLVS